MIALNQLLITLRVEANVFHNGQYCGAWVLDTSGTHYMSFHVVSHGECLLEAGGQKTILKAGDAVFFPTDASHRIGSTKDDNTEINQADSKPMTDALEPDATGLVCGYFAHQHPVFDRLMVQLPEMMIIRNNQNAMTNEVMRLIMAESKSSGQSTNLLLNRLADCLLYLLLRDHIDISQGVFAALLHPKLSKSFELIHGALEKRLSVDELASNAGMSRSAFSALFKDIVGQSPIEYMTEWRIAQAYRWLADDRITTMEAAIRSGYETEASFSKAFKRVMGFGPGAARREAG